MTDGLIPFNVFSMQKNASYPLVLGLALGLAACGTTSTPFFAGEITLAPEAPERCDPLDPRHCLLPFPSDTFTVEDEASVTGRRVAFARASMITNARGVQVDPSEWNRNDGFSPGAQIATFVPDLDVAASRIPSVADIGASLAPDAGAVILDTESGERVPYWGEIDASVADVANTVLYVRPAINLRHGHRYIVALRNLVHGDGSSVTAGDAFRAYRDRLHTNVPEMEARRDRYERVFTELEAAGVGRADLFLAWDFTVASSANLTERLVHIRDDAFDRLGSAAPGFEVTQVEDPLDERVLRRVSGTFEVPLYMTGGGVPGQSFAWGSNGLPAYTGTYSAAFRCIVPRSAFAADGSAAPARPAVYGHGLLGSEGEVSAGNVRSMANEHGFVFCATRWIGMAEEDVGNAVAILQDISKMDTNVDRLQQGVLNTLFLGRLMIHADGLGSHPAFQGTDGRSVIDRRELYYDGNSQGGIMGGIATAVAIDWTKAVLGVPAMNYSLLLQRSVDWDTYRSIYDPSYPNEIERGIGLSLLQMQWDRGEANGYAWHMTDDPLPGTPAHRVLMHVAFGDHQVAPAAADVQARTIGASVHTPVVTPGRLADREPAWGIEPIPSYPFDGSAIIVWDSGAAAPPLTNMPPREGEDPHGDPRSYVEARRQKAAFLAPESRVIDVCGNAPCTAPPS